MSTLFVFIPTCGCALHALLTTLLHVNQAYADMKLQSEQNTFMNMEELEVVLIQTSTPTVLPERN